MSFSKYIKEIRDSYNLTQAELAKKLDISPTAVVNIEASRTTYPRHDVFNNLVKNVVVGSNRYEVALGLLFNDQIEDYGVNVPSNIQKYLAYIWAFEYNIDINDVYKITNNNKKLFNAVVWRAGLNYYKMVIADYDRVKFVDLINHCKQENLGMELKKLIFEESDILDRMDNNKNIKEIRFVLDASNKDDQLVFENIKKINMPNHGKIADISFELFDVKSIEREKQKRFYVTNRISHIGI